MLFPNPTLSNCSPVHLGLYPNQLCPLQTLSIREFVQTLLPKKNQLCPTLPLSTWDSIQTNSAHYRLCPNLISEYHSVQTYPCPSRALSKPASSVHQRICPNTTMSNRTPVHLGLYPNLHPLSITESVQTLFPNPTLSNYAPVHLGLYSNQLCPL